MLRALLFFVLLFSVASALTHRQVKSSCTGLTYCYTDFNSAVLNATAGDIITVDAGTWTLTANVDMYIPLSIVGAGSGSTVIDCANYELDFYYAPYYVQGFNFSSCYELYVEGASAVFQDIIVWNANDYIMYGYYSSITCRDCTFQSSDTYVYMEYSSMGVEGDLHLIDLTSSSALYLEDGATMYVDGSVIALCNAASDFTDGIFYLDNNGQTVHITGDFNSTGCNNIALFVEEAAVVIDGDLIITNNSKWDDWVVYLEYGAAMVVNGDVTFENCHAPTTSGGALIAVYEGGSMIIQGDLTMNNIATPAATGLDGLIYLYYGGELLVTGSMTLSNINAISASSSTCYIIYNEGGFLANIGPVTITDVYLNATSGSSTREVKVTAEDDSGERSTTEWDYFMYMYGATWTTVSPVLIQKVNGIYYSLIYNEDGQMATGDSFTMINNNNPYSDAYLNYQEYSSWVAVGDVVLNNNIVGDYHFYLYESSMISYGSLTVSNNTAYSAPCYVEESGLITYGPVQMSGNNMVGTDVGALGTDYMAWVSFDTVTFDNNNYGAVYMDYSSWLAEGDVVISNNKGKWAAFYFSEESSWITNGAVMFDSNVANTSGGAVGFYDYSAWQSNGPVTFTNNVCGDFGGAVYIENSYNAWASRGPITFSGNVAQYGGAVYIASTWANSYYDATFTNNNGLTSGNDVFCDSTGYFFSLSQACNTTTIHCVPGCQYSTITNVVSVASNGASLSGIGSSMSAMVTLSSALPVDLTVEIEYVNGNGFEELVPLSFTPATITAGTTTGWVSVSVMGSTNLQGSIQLKPPTPELLVLLHDTSNAFSLRVTTSGASDLLSFSWLSLFHEALAFLL